MPVFVLNIEKVNAIRKMERQRINHLDSARRLNHEAQAKLFNVTRRTIERIHFEGQTKGSDFPQLHITDDDIKTILLLESLNKSFKKLASDLTRKKQALEFNVHHNTVEKIHNGVTWSGIRRNKDGSYHRVSY